MANKSADKPFISLTILCNDSKVIIFTDLGTILKLKEKSECSFLNFKNILGKTLNVLHMDKERGIVPTTRRRNESIHN